MIFNLFSAILPHNNINNIIMPPKYNITFVNGNTEITFGIYCTKKDLEYLGLKQLNETVKNPLDYKIKL